MQDYKISKPFQNSRFSFNQTQATFQLTSTPSTKSLKDNQQAQNLRNRISSNYYNKDKLTSPRAQEDSHLLQRQNDMLRIQIRHLKQQNSLLKKQIEKFVRKPPLPSTARTYQKSKNSQKQVDLYQEIIHKLEERVEILLLQNRDLKEANETFGRKLSKIQETESLVKQIRRIEDLVRSLEEDVQKDDDEWELYKDLLGAEKQYYKEIIGKLQFQVGCLKKY